MKNEFNSMPSSDNSPLNVEKQFNIEPFWSHQPIFFALQAMMDISEG